MVRRALVVVMLAMWVAAAAADGPSREEIGCYACQIHLDAETLARAIRSHWGIENQDHYVRDVTLGEDGSRIRQKPGAMARIRSAALNILRANGI